MPKNPALRATLIVSAILTALAAAVFMSSGPSDEELSEQQYCRMVEMYRNDPSRSTGWPDFNNNYDEVCNAR